jgi:hypothetical protein
MLEYPPRICFWPDRNVKLPDPPKKDQFFYRHYEHKIKDKNSKVWGPKTVSSVYKIAPRTKYKFEFFIADFNVHL